MYLPTYMPTLDKIASEALSFGQRHSCTLSFPSLLCLTLSRVCIYPPPVGPCALPCPALIKYHFNIGPGPQIRNRIRGSPSASMAAAAAAAASDSLFEKHEFRPIPYTAPSL